MLARIRSCLITVGLALALVGGCAKRDVVVFDNPSRPDANTVVASVNGRKITQAELEIAMSQVREYQIMNTSLTAGATPVQQSLRELALDKIINEILMVQEARRRGLKVSQDEIDEHLRDFQASNIMGMQTIFKDKSLKKHYENTLEDKVRDELLKAKLKEDVLANIKVPFEEIYKYYTDNADEFVQNATISVRHILVAVPKGSSKEVQEKAERKVNILRRLILRGKDFAELAREHSDDDLTAPFGGDLGTFRKSEQIAGIHNKAFSLKVGEVSDPIRDERGFHLLLVTDKTDVQVKPIVSVESYIRSYLKVQKNIEAARHLTEDLRAKARIKLY